MKTLVRRIGGLDWQRMTNQAFRKTYLTITLVPRLRALEDGRWAENKLRSAVLWWRASRKPTKPISKRTSVVLRRRPTRENEKTDKTKERKKNGEGDQQDGGDRRRMEAIPPSQGASLTRR